MRTIFRNLRRCRQSFFGPSSMELDWRTKGQLLPLARWPRVSWNILSLLIVMQQHAAWFVLARNLASSGLSAGAELPPDMSNMRWLSRATGGGGGPAGEPLHRASHQEAPPVEVEESRQRPPLASVEEFHYITGIYQHRSEQIARLSGPTPKANKFRGRENRCRRPETTVIHSFPYLGTKERYLRFKIQQRRSSERLCTANLRLYFQSREGQDYRSPYYHHRYQSQIVLRLDMLARLETSNRTAVVASQSQSISSQEFSGWFDIDVSAAFRLQGSSTNDDYNLWFLPVVTVYGSDTKADITTNPVSNNRPLLVMHNSVENKHGFDESLMEALQEVEKIQKKAQRMEENSSRGNVSKASLSRNKRGAFDSQCGLRRLPIPMSAIGLKHVLLPPVFPMTYCQGSCSHPIIPPTVSSLHGQVMAMLHSLDHRRRRQTLEPCCAPSEELAGIDMLFLWPSGGFMIKYYADMLALSCECN